MRFAWWESGLPYTGGEPHVHGTALPPRGVWYRFGGNELRHRGGKPHFLGDTPLARPIQPQSGRTELHFSANELPSERNEAHFVATEAWLRPDELLIRTVEPLFDEEEPPLRGFEALSRPSELPWSAIVPPFPREETLSLRSKRLSSRSELPSSRREPPPAPEEALFGEEEARTRKSVSSARS
jgi:hypothetical protein